MQTAHPWHGIDHRFEREKALVDGVIEIPRGSKAKFEVDKASGLIRLDRVIFAAFHYPINYGFIPRTLGEDGDPLDILVLSEVSTVPLCLVRSRIIGMMEMEDSGEPDEKIIAVATNDASVEHIRSIGDLPANFRSELKHFFTEYKSLRNKKVLVDEFLPAERALDKVEEAIARYTKTIAR
ncbi:MAG: inorganic diphosphatase [Bacteroidota bacterium]